jgi:hypothetical protein
MIEQAKPGDGNLERPHAAWTDFPRITKVVVARPTLIIPGVANATH